MKTPRFFVTGTDTGVGKTEASVALLRLMIRSGIKPFAFKPYESGVTATSKTSDSVKLQKAAGGWQSLEQISPHRFRAPLAPAVAARLEHRHPSWKQTLKQYAQLGSGPGIVEGAGGIFVPLDDRHQVIDLIEQLKLPVVVVARAGLGTINHTLLTLEALAHRQCSVSAVILSRSTRGVDSSIPYNAPEIQKYFHAIPIFGPVPFAAHPANRGKYFEQCLAPLMK